MKKILVMGLPGAGKTTLATLLAERLNAVHLNGDALREFINRDLGFRPSDRIEQARRMGWLADQIVKAGHFAVCDFVCPMEVTRSAFTAGGRAFVIWVDRISASRFSDTNSIFEPPTSYDVRVSAEGHPNFWSAHVLKELAYGLQPA